MEKLKMQTKNIADKNFEALSKMFPNAVTETMDENGDLVRAIDADVLRQEISCTVVEGKEERYQFTWPDKKNAVINANTSTSLTLRADKEKSIGNTGKDGEWSSENVYIEGDNLDSLKIMRETYFNKIKIIYIDPPYNTGSDFIYQDDFSIEKNEFLGASLQYDEEGNRLVQNTNSNGRFHTDWLNMLYPRLKIAKDLLTSDGIIFISIDDNEAENLKKMCCEIFGESNFIGQLSVENNPKGRKNSAFVSVSSEYCIIFAKNKSLSHFVENVPKKATDMSLDEDGRYVHNSGKRVLVGENSFNNVVTSFNSEKNYSVYYRETDRVIEIRREKYGEVDENLISKGFEKYYSHFGGKLIENTYTKDKLVELFNDKALEFSNGKIYEKNFSDTIRIKSQLVNREYEAIVHGEKKKFSMELTTTGAGTYLKDLFGLKETPFPAPKNTGYLKMLLSLIEDKNCLILDFFSGSGSTADAVMQLNSQDGGNRHYIMIQVPEKCEEKSVAFKAGYQTICEIGEERIRRAGKKIKEETGAEIDYGFRVFQVDSSNMKDVYYNPSDTQQNFLDGFADNIKEDRTPEDLLFQVMLDLGVLLSSKIEETEIAGKKIFNVADNFLIACFDKDVTDETIKAIAEKKPYYAVFRDGSIANDSVLTNFDQIFESISPKTERRVL